MKKIFKNIFLSVIVLLTLFSANPVKAMASQPLSGYTWVVVYDDVNNSYVGVVGKKDYGNDYKNWSWPGVQGFRGNTKDKAYVDSLNDTLLEDLNIAIKQANMYRTGDIVPSITDIITAAEAKSQVANSNVKFEAATSDDLISASIDLSSKDYKGSKLSDFVTLVLPGRAGNARIPLRFSAPKGYGAGEALEGVHSFTDDQIANYNIPVTWHTIAEMSSYYESQGISLGDTGAFFGESDVSKQINTWLDETTSNVVGALGVPTMESLIFNTGSRSRLSYYGLVDRSWFDAASVIYWICQVIAVFLMVIGIISMALKRNMSILNPEMRASLKSSLIDLLYSIIMMGVFLVFFYLLVYINYSFVKLLASATPGKTLMDAMNFTGLTGVIFCLVSLFISIRMTVTYVLRGITVLLLYATAPLFIASITFGKKGKEMFSTWLQQLISNIFMQSCHAIVLMIYLLVLDKGDPNNLIRFILMYSFIPMTKLFKDMILKPNIADGATDAATNGVAGIGLGIGATVLSGAGAIATAGAGKNVAGKLANEDGKGGSVVGSNKAKGTIAELAKDNLVADSEKQAKYRVGEAIDNTIKTGQATKADNKFSGKRALGAAARIAGGAGMKIASLGVTLGGNAAGINTGEFTREINRAGNNTLGIGVAQAETEVYDGISAFKTATDNLKTNEMTFTNDDLKEMGYTGVAEVDRAMALDFDEEEGEWEKTSRDDQVQFEVAEKVNNQQFTRYKAYAEHIAEENKYNHSATRVVPTIERAQNGKVLYNPGFTNDMTKSADGKNITLKTKANDAETLNWDTFKKNANKWYFENKQ